MEREKLESLLIDYIDGKLNSVDKHHIEQELMKNPASYKLYEELKEVIRVMAKVAPAEPSGSLRTSFDQMLKRELEGSRQARVVSLRPWWYAVAAGLALLITGLSIGFFIANQKKQSALLAEEQRKKAHTLHVVSLISDTESAGQRILGVKEAVATPAGNDEIFEVLIKTMDEDPNTNVRLAAIEALRRFSDEPMVRKALIASLGKQTDPVIQIALIQLMVDLKEKEAVKPLENIVEDETMLESVKDEAHRGIMVLS